jgi:tetratricopeptide (TPR) repeat protein
MRRAPGLPAALVAALVAALALAACERPAPPQQAPQAAAAPRRVLLVTLDTTRADRLGCYGWKAARTPFLDELAAHGVRYAMARCAAPITLPSHATILSGVLPCAHGVRDNGLFVLDGAATLLSEVVKERGFATGAFVGSFILDGRYGLAQGFDVYHGPPPSRLGLQREVIERPASAVVDDALGWLEKLDRGASLFLWVHFYDAHAPHVGSYDDEIASCDAQLARLRKRLDELGFGEGLLEIVTADHGEGLGEHGEETHGVLLHDATMRVPLLLRGGGLPSGLVVETAVSHVQIAPTVLGWLALSRAALPEAIAPSLPLAESGDEAPALLETLLPLDLHRWAPLHGIVLKGRKLVRGRFDELFDVAADPGETKDLAKEQPELVAKLARAMDAAFAAQPKLPAPHDAVLSAAERARLRSLGYADGAAPTATGSDALPDPREAIRAGAVQMRALDLLSQARALLGQDAALAQHGEAAVDEAKRARARQLLDEARALLTELAQKYPRDPSIAFDLGNVELSSGRPAEAVPRFELAVEADPANSADHYNLAVAYAGAGQPAFAAAEMEKAIQCEPLLVVAWRWLIFTHAQRGEFGRAAWYAAQCEASGALEAGELASFRANRAQIEARMKAAGQKPDPSPTWPPKDLRPERVRVGK